MNSSDETNVGKPEDGEVTIGNVCTNAACPSPQKLGEDGLCPTCWAKPGEARAPAADSASWTTSSESTRSSLTLQDARRVRQPLLEFLFDAPPPTDRAIGSNSVILPIASTREGSQWRSHYYEPASPLIPFHQQLGAMTEAADRCAWIGHFLSFLARVEEKGISPSLLSPDAVWCNPNHADDFLLLLGPQAPQDHKWGAEAVRVTANAWGGTLGLGRAEASDVDLLDWLVALMAVSPPLDAGLVGVLRDSLCDNAGAQLLSATWARAIEHERSLLACRDGISAIVRFGLAQRVGRIKSNDALLPREQQEDRLDCRRVSFTGTDEVVMDRILLAVADGVSSCDYGSGAAAAERAMEIVSRSSPEPGESERDYLHRVLAAASDAVRAYGEAIRANAPADAEPPSSTLTLAILGSDGWVDVAWLGDSPAYKWDGSRNTFVPLCFPHSDGFESLFAGEGARAIRAREGANHLSRYLGAVSGEPSHVRFRLGENEGILLMSDGFLSGFSGTRGVGRTPSAARTLAQRFAEHQRRVGNLMKVCEDLCTESDDAGGQDNLSVVAAWLGRLEPSSGKIEPAPKAELARAGRAESLPAPDPVGERRRRPSR